MRSALLLVSVLGLSLPVGVASAVPPDPALTRGRTLFERGRLREARDSLLQAYARDPKSPDAPYLLALVYRKGERYEEAAGWLTKGIALAPTRFALRYSLGVVRLQQGRPERALASLDRALALRARVPDAPFTRGEAQAALRRFGEAEAAFEAAAKLDPRHWKAAYRLGLLRKRRRDLEGAREALEAARAHSPDARILYNLALVARLAGRSSEAATLFSAFRARRSAERVRELQARDRRKSKDLVERARLDLAEDDAQEAVRLLKRALALWPHPRAFAALAEAYRRAGQPKKAAAAKAQAEQN